MKSLRATIVYIIVLVVMALALLASVWIHTNFPPNNRLVLAGVLAVVGMVAFLFPLRISSSTIFSLHTSVLFAATLLFEPAIAMLVAASMPLPAQFIRRKAWEETIFSAAHFMLQVGIGGVLLRAGGWNFNALTFDRPEVVVLVGAVALVMYSIECAAVAIIVGLESQRSPLDVWRQWVRVDNGLLSQYALGLLGAMIANASVWALVLIVPPLLVIYRSNQQQVLLRRQAQDLEYQAFHDALTGLPNRALFLDRVQQALHRTSRSHHNIAVLFLDLDQFKNINDSLGHEAGDQLLQAVAHRLLACVRPEDTVARLGGDEFTMLLENIQDAPYAVAVAERIKAALQDVFVVAEQHMFVSASIGIALSNNQHDTPSDLLRHADAAMYKAKEQGRASYHVFDPHHDARALTRLQLETDLYQALERREFVVFYQPLVDLASGKIVSFEALVRWIHPERGVVSPAQFIPLAEETGLILPLGELVLRTACQQARVWLGRLPADTPLRISVNLSARQFQHVALVDDVTQVLTDTGLEPHRLQLEITESVVVQHASSAIATLHNLKRLGVRLAIDDFGTGYSSLSYLKHLPVDTLKIDKAFVDRLSHDAADAAITQAIITLARTLNLQTVAEGVETHDQLRSLHVLGCELGQGYLFAQPVSSDVASTLIAKNALAQATRVAASA